MKIFARLLVVLVALFLLAFMFVQRYPSQSYLKAMRLEKAVLNLPSGSNKSKIESLFKEEDVEFFYYGDKESIDNESDVKDNGYSSANLSGFGGAGLHYTSHRFFSMFARYTWFFDKNGKLLKATVSHMSPSL